MRRKEKNEYTPYICIKNLYVTIINEECIILRNYHKLYRTINKYNAKNG